MSSDQDLHPELPVDPDPVSTGVTTRPQHAQPALLGLVAVGGLAGTAVRYGVGLLAPSESGRWPVGTFVVNLAGAFLLGVLLEGLARSGPDEGWRRRLRLLAGTGFCGAFTTYSTFAVEVNLLVRDGARGTAAAYAVVSVFSGLLVSAAGVAAAAGYHGRRTGGTAS